MVGFGSVSNAKDVDVEVSVSVLSSTEVWVKVVTTVSDSVDVIVVGMTRVVVVVVESVWVDVKDWVVDCTRVFVTVTDELTTTCGALVEVTVLQANQTDVFSERMSKLTLYMG